MTIQSTDQLGNSITLGSTPKRIISLVPSQTEFLFDLGLDNEIVGITRFCIHPTDKVKGKTQIGGTKRFDFEKIKALAPDLIIGNKEENYREGIEELQKHFPVWMSDIFTLDDSYNMMLEIARIVNRQTEGERIVAQIKTSLVSTLPHLTGLTCAYFIWRKPYMVVGNNTFIDHMLGVFGVKNAFAHLSRYPEITPETLSVIAPDLIFLSSEPYAFSEKHIEEFAAFSPNSKVVVVDGEIFSWYGTRLLHAASYFQQLREQLIC